MSTLFNTASEIVQDAVDSPLTVLRKLGLNIPSKKDVSTGVTTTVETISPAADFKEMITGSEEFSQGDYLSGGAKMLGGLAGAFVPGSAKIRSTGKAVGDIADKKLLDMKYTRETPKKKGAFSSMNLAAEGKITDQEAIGGLFNPYTLKNKKMIMGPDSSNLNTSRIEISTFPPPGENIPGFGMKAADDIGLPASQVGNRISNDAIEVQTNLIEGSKWKWEGKVPEGFENNTHLVSMKGGSKLKKASGGPTDHSYATKVIYEKGGNLSTYDTRAKYVKELHKSIPESLAALKIKIPKEVKKVTKELKAEGKSTEEIKKKVDALKKKLTRDYKGDNPKGKPTTVGVPEFGTKIGDIKKGGIIQPVYDQIIMREAGGQVMPMQYGGGLSDAYSTLSDRRRNQNMYGMGNAPMQQTPSQMSSAFQDPLEASAFSPVNMEHGGDIVVPKERMINDQPHELSYINPQEAGLLKALGGSGRRVDGIPAYFMSDAEMDQADFDAGAFTGDTQGRGDAGENYATIDSQGNQTQAADIAADRANQEQFLAKGREIDDNRLINYATQIGRELDTYEDQKNNMLGDKTLKGFRNSVRNSLVNDLINAGVQDPDKVADQMMARSGSGFGDVASGSMTGEGGLSNFFYERGERFKDQLQSRIEELKKDDEVIDKDKGFFSSLKNMINNPLKDKIGKDPQIRDFLASQGVKDFRSFDQFSPTNLAIKGGLSLIPGVGTASTIGTLLSKLTGSEVVGTFSDPVTGKMMSLDTLGNTTFISPDSLTSGAADESGNDQIKEEVIKDPIDKPVVVEEDEKSAMSQLLAKRINNTSTIDPNVKIIMDVYGISQEEAQEFLGKKGVGTGGASEFEGI